MKKILITLFSFLLLSRSVWATDLSITCDNSKCETVPGGQAALFSEYEFPNYDIKPGDIIKRQITVNNQNNENCNLYLTIKNTVTTSPHSLDEVLDTVIKDNNVEYYGKVSATGGATGDKTLTNLYNDGLIYLGTINPGSKRIYDWIVSIDSKVGNEYQRAKTKFDFTTTFECGDPFATPTPSPFPSSPPGTGKQASFGIRRPTCDNLQFEMTYTAKNDGNAIKNVEVIFSYQGANEQVVKTNENGYANAFFNYSGSGEVKAVASDGFATLTGTIDTLNCSGIGGGGLILGLQNASKSISQGINQVTKQLGETLGQVMGEVKGENSACCPLIEPLWWIMLLLQTLFLTRFYMQRIKVANNGQWLLVTLAATILVIMMHWLGHPWFIKRGYIESQYCNWFWLMAIINSLFLGAVFRYVFKEEHEQE